MAGGKPEQGADKQAGGGLFGQKLNNEMLLQEINQLRQENNSLSRRVRELEERYQNFRKKVNGIDMNLLSQSKKISNESRLVYSDINEIKNLLNEFDNKLLILVKEIKGAAKQEDVRVLQKYIDMWEPIRFVTRREVEKIVEDFLDKKIEGKGLNKSITH